MFWDYTGDKAVPNLAKGLEMQDSGRAWLVHLRRGMKWSDGKPFTADDFVFWFEDIYRNKDLVPTPTAVMAINGKQGVIEKVDTHTVRFKFPEPYFMLPDVLAGSTDLAGQWGAYRGMGGFAPAHYLKQFHPKYVSAEELDKQAKEAKFDSWVRMFLAKNDWALNPDLPVLSPWKTVTPINTPTWTLERNPVQRLRGHRRQPAPLHRQGRADARREPRSAEPARDRRRVRLRVAARRPRQAARLPREPAEGQLQGLPGPRRLLRPDHQVQPELRRGCRDREVVQHRRLPARALARHQPRSDQRDVLARHGHAGLRGAGGQQQVQPGAAVPEALVHARRQEGQRDARQDRAREEGRARATGSAATARAGCASRS